MEYSVNPWDLTHASSPHGERLVFRCLHDFTFARPLVVDAAEVQDAG